MDCYTVYKHTNKINGKVYIGITSRDPSKRWKNGKGYKSQHFERAIEKYGWDRFEHTIIATRLSKQDACELERILIKAYNATDPHFGYNETLGGEGGGMYHKHHTKETKEKIGVRMKEMTFSDEHKRHISEAKKGIKHHLAKKVYQYTKDMVFIKEWDYMSLAANTLRISKGNIGEVCNGHRKTAGGYVWKYERGEYN